LGAKATEVAAEAAAAARAWRGECEEGAGAARGLLEALISPTPKEEEEEEERERCGCGCGCGAVCKPVPPAALPLAAPGGKGEGSKRRG
jgi:hypothetical protein